MTYNCKDQTHEQQTGIHTDRNDNLHEGPVPMTYPCPQPSSWLVQVPVITAKTGSVRKEAQATTMYLNPVKGLNVETGVFYLKGT